MSDKVVAPFLLSNPRVVTSPSSNFSENARGSFFSEGMGIALGMAVIAVLLQMIFNGRYGYFRDELYFIAASDHLDWGYVDFAPLSALLLKISRSLFGTSLHALRLFPALAFGAMVWLTGLITRELGGKRFAIFLACGSALLTPAFVGETTRYAMNPFEPLFWMGSIYFLVRTINSNQPKLAALVRSSARTRH